MHKQNRLFSEKNISFLSKDDAREKREKNRSGAAEYFLLLVRGPGCVFVVAAVIAV